MGKSAQRVESQHSVMIKDGLFGGVPVRVSLEVPAGFVVKNLGMERGDSEYRDGDGHEGYVILKLSVKKEAP